MTEWDLCRYRWLAAFAVVTVLAVSAGAAMAAKVDPAADERAIRALDEQWNRAIVAKDDATIAGLYSPDAALYPPGMPKVVGHDNIRKFWTNLFSMNASLIITTVEIRVAKSGDLATDVGTWVFSVPGGSETRGKYLVVWSKVGGNWKVMHDFWNDDAPPPAPLKAEPAG